MINPPVRSELLYSVPEASEFSDDQTCRPKKEDRYKQALQACNEETRSRKAEDNANFDGLQIGHIDKSLKPQFPVYNSVQEPLYVNNEPTSNIVESQKCRKFCSQEFEEV